MDLRSYPLDVVCDLSLTFQISTVTRLPKYVAINLIRFFFKTDKNVSAKVLKDVKFPESLDLFDIADDELKGEIPTA